jgi:ribose 5-phosphate isomerase B
MKVYFASDHAGFSLKNELVNFVRGELSYDVEDCGASEMLVSDDYPPIIAQAAKAVQNDISKNIWSRAIVIGGSGTGEAIVANRFEGIRAALYYGGSEKILTLSREHNDANVLSLGARFLSTAEAKAAVKVWLATQFTDDERHVRRIAQIDKVVDMPAQKESYI